MYKFIRSWGDALFYVALGLSISFVIFYDGVASLTVRIIIAGLCFFSLILLFLLSAMARTVDNLSQRMSQIERMLVGLEFGKEATLKEVED